MPSCIGCILVDSPFGLKGAALAAFGEMPGVLLTELLAPLTVKDGVKLGESTFKRFFTLMGGQVSKSSHQRVPNHTIPIYLALSLMRLHRVMVESTSYRQGQNHSSLSSCGYPDLCLHIDSAHRL